MPLAPKEGGGLEDGYWGESPLLIQIILDPELLAKVLSEEEPAPETETKEHQRTFVFSPE